MKKISLFMLLLAIISPVFLSACGIQKSNELQSFESQDKQVQDGSDNLSEIMPEEPKLIEIVDLDDAFDTILNSSTREFIGGHPIDEAFLLFVADRYSTKTIEEIAAYANFDSADIWYECTGESIHVLWYEYCQKTNLESFDNDRIEVVNTSDDHRFVMDFTGDLILADKVATTEFMDHQINGIADCFSEELIGEMKAADIMMINNEFSYTNRGEAIAGKAFTFRADPGRVKLLNELGVDIVSIANNHVWDYGAQGMSDTISTLRDANMPFVGAGDNLKEAMRPYYYIANGMKIAVVAATQIERSYNYTRQATDTEPGVLKSLNDELFVEVIKEAKANADKVIVFIHWGTEGNMQHGSDQVKLARDFVKAGADVIVGGHTHCLQSIEYMDEVPIYYSLGNFYFSSTMNMPADYDTGMAQVIIDKSGKIDVKFIPCHFSKGVLTMLDNENGGRIYEMLNSLSSSARIDEQGIIHKQIQE